MINLDKKIRILVVDDDEDDFILLKDYLQDIRNFQFSIEWVSGFNNAEEVVKTNEFDLYFFDYLLGANTGLELLKKVISYGITSPIIFLTGKGDRSTDMEAMKLGAADYLVKAEIDPEKLERSIRYALDRHKTLKALKESETRYRSIFERSRDMIYITDDTGRFITVNESATRIFGYTHEEFSEIKAIDLYNDPKDREAYLDAIRRSGVVSNFEVALRDKDGNIRHCIISGSMQRMGDENRIYYHGIIHDITRRKKAEKDLIIAEKLAATGRIVRTLAHEVRNPLTNINLSVEQLEEEVANDDLRMYMDIIKRNSKRINDLISELLHSSKPTEINAVKYPLNKLIDQTIELAIDRITLKNLKIIRDYDETTCDVQVDASVMKIAILNIIINAIEAMPENTGVLCISTRAREDKCVIIINDNGCGISKDDLGKLFEPYFTGKADGIGLGLATTHNIIQSHRGNIEVESEPGKGTTFTITLNP